MGFPFHNRYSQPKVKGIPVLKFDDLVNSRDLKFKKFSQTI